MRGLLQECYRGHNKFFSDREKVNLRASKIFSVEQAKTRITLVKKQKRKKIARGNAVKEAVKYRRRTGTWH